MVYCDCGRWNNRAVETALNYLPHDIYSKIDGRIAIITLRSDATRLAKKACEHEEIIILSPWIFTFIPSGSDPTHAEFQYLIFGILHEIAHAVFDHKPPNEITEREKIAQEAQSDEYALKWFNKYALENRDKGYKTITIEEIKETQKEYKKKLEQILTDNRQS
jgi:hypothetical protein